MYINYVQDRKELGYECLIDIKFSNLCINHSSVIFIKDFSSNTKRKTIRAIIVFSFGVGIPFSYLKPAEAIGTNFAPQQTLVISPSNSQTSIKQSNIEIDSYIESKIKMLLTYHFHLINQTFDTIFGYSSSF